MKATISSGILLDARHPTRRFVDALSRALTRENPDRVKARQRGARYLGHMPEEICYLRKLPGDQLWMPGGAFQVLQEVAKAHGVVLEWDNRTVSNRTASQVPLDSLGMKLRDYQREAVGVLQSRVRGYIVLPPGAGKTVIGSAALIATGQRSLVLGHTLEIVDQWETKLATLRPGLPIVRIGGGYGPASLLRQVPPGGVAVGTMQTVAPAVETDPGLLSSFGTVLVDEVHHAACQSLITILGTAPARYKWGLTATPERADGYGFLLDWFVGPELLRVPYARLIAGGHLHRPRIVPVRSGITVYSADEAGNQIAQHDRVATLASDKVLLEGVAKLAGAAYQAGRVTLALLPRLTAVSAVLALLRGLGVPSASVTGDTPRDSRARRVEQLRAGVLPVTLSCQVADEGLDAPRCDCLISANPGRDPGRATQRVGRILRPQGAPPIVFDVVHQGMAGQWRTRRSAYMREFGVEIDSETSFEGAAGILSRAYTS